MNTTNQMGRLTKDLDLRYTGNGKAVASGTLAVTRNFKNGNGEREADFLNIVIWGKSAESLANYTRKGSLIGITGRLQSRSYDNSDNQKVYVTEIVVEDYTLAETKETLENRIEQNGGKKPADKSFDGLEPGN